MNLYTLVLFLHITGDIGIFIGLGVQLLSLAALRRVTRVEQARILAGLLHMVNPLGVISALVTIAAGLYMAATVWTFQLGWIAVALGSIIVLLAPIIGGVIEPRVKAVIKATDGAPDGPLPHELATRIHDPILGTGLQTGAAVVLGIVFLMTIKPMLFGSIVTMLVALLLGLASGLPLWLSRKQTGRMDS